MRRRVGHLQGTAASCTTACAAVLAPNRCEPARDFTSSPCCGTMQPGGKPIALFFLLEVVLARAAAGSAGTVLLGHSRRERPIRADGARTREDGCRCPTRVAPPGRPVPRGVA